MKIGVLGPLIVWNDDGEEVGVGGPTPRHLLVTLVAAGGEGIGVDQLVDELWDDPAARPAGPAASIRTYVARLRSALGADAIITASGTYRLGSIETDAIEFERLVADIRRSTATPALIDRWGAALALWRGDAYAGHDESDIVRSVVTHLDELRSAATQAWIDARLEHGETREVIADIDREIARNPLDEGLRMQQMTALAKAGRQAEALRAAQDLRADLTEIGLEPSRKVAGLEQKIAADQTIPPATASPNGSSNGAGANKVRGYRIGDRIGEGAFAVVFKATQSSVEGTAPAPVGPRSSRRSWELPERSRRTSR